MFRPEILYLECKTLENSDHILFQSDYNLQNEIIAFKGSIMRRTLQFLAHSMSLCNREASVCPSVRPSVNFAQIATSTTEVAGSLPNLHTMVPRRARIQDVLRVKVKGHIIRTLFCLH